MNGLIKPYSTIALLAVYFLGRQLFTWGYFEKEGAVNKKRMAGSLLCNLAHVGTVGMSLYVAWVLRRGKLVGQLIPK